MALLLLGLPFKVSVPANSTYKTIVTMRAPAGQHLAVRGLEIHGDGVAGDRIGVELRLRRVTPGNGTSSVTITPGCHNRAYQIQWRGTYKADYSVAPTAAGVSPTADEIWRTEFHPQGGRQFDWSLRTAFDIPADTELSLDALVATGQDAVSLFGSVTVEE